jgi:hypothetical protein
LGQPKARQCEHPVPVKRVAFLDEYSISLSSLKFGVDLHC